MHVIKNKLIVVVILLILISSRVTCQEVVIADFDANCNESFTENIYLIKNQIFGYDLNYKILSIGIVVNLNCGGADTGYVQYRGDTLFLFSDYVTKKTIVNGEVYIEEEEAECDCNFELTYDIYGFDKIPSVVMFNESEYELNNFKYVSSISRNDNELENDNFGYYYRYLYSDSGSLKSIIRDKATKRQLIKFNANNEIISISTAKGSLENMRIVEIK